MSLLLILLPILAGLALFGLPRADTRASKIAGCVVAAITFLLPIVLGGDGTFAAHWLSRPFTASLHFAWNGPAYWIVLLLALCTFCAILGTNMTRPRVLISLLLMLEGAMMGVFEAKDVLAFA
ncbi:MAG TPA: hypothetical protein VFA29_14090, partial [Candidatus Baltobacteraceae bacterium]|nr:hypothetical protein [Candidatus Baltobacteraceae bacterium]